MGLRGRKSIASRFMKYVQSLVEVIGHADRAGPLQDYCTGLAAASGRKSVEPMAAITAPERTAAQHRLCCILLGRGHGRTTWSWRRCARWCCPRSSAMARSKPGSSTTPAFLRKESTRLGLRINTAGNSANRQIVRSLCRRAVQRSVLEG